MYIAYGRGIPIRGRGPSSLGSVGLAWLLRRLVGVMKIGEFLQDSHSLCGYRPTSRVVWMPTQQGNASPASDPIGQPR